MPPFHDRICGEGQRIGFQRPPDKERTVPSYTEALRHAGFGEFPKAAREVPHQSHNIARD